MIKEVPTVKWPCSGTSEMATTCHVIHSRPTAQVAIRIVSTMSKGTHFFTGKKYSFQSNLNVILLGGVWIWIIRCSSLSQEAVTFSAFRTLDKRGGRHILEHTGAIIKDLSLGVTKVTFLCRLCYLTPWPLPALAINCGGRKHSFWFQYLIVETYN